MFILFSQMHRFLQRKILIPLAIAAAVSLVLLGAGLGYGLTRWIENGADDLSPAAVTAISEACSLIGRYKN